MNVIKTQEGNWQARVQVNGKRHVKTFARKADAQAWALELKKAAVQKRELPSSLTVGEAMTGYISAKSGVLAASTIAGYERIKKNHLLQLQEVAIDALTQERVQVEVSRLAAENSPKTVRNVIGLFTAAMAMYAPSKRFSITLPQKDAPKVLIPSQAEIKAISEAVKDTSVELPTMLAMMMGLRISEILGLRYGDIAHGRLHVQRALVDEGLKKTKTVGSDRWLAIPPKVAELIPEGDPDEPIVKATRRQIYCRFEYWMKKRGPEQHYRFHDLRHVFASAMMDAGLNQASMRARMGHSTNAMLDRIYVHRMAETEQEADTQLAAYFNRLV